MEKDMANKSRSPLKSLVNVFFPPRCLCCGDILERQDSLCENCLDALTPVSEDCCPHCGRDKGRCTCQNGKDLLFDGAVSAFYYEGTGRALLQKFKFQGEKNCYDFVLERPFLRRVKDFYRGVEFSFILPVPPYKKDKRPFDQTLYIARSLSKALKVPCRTDLLIKTRSTPPQHLQKGKDRERNVENAFKALKIPAMQGACVLLADDVATTFSTLNACAAALKLAGAGRIFCATPLTTLYRG